MVNRKLLIAVIGGSSATPQEAAAAETIGRTLAEAGAVLVCGGRGGVMEAACRGAQAAGGLTVGILPGNDAGEANPHVELVIPTGIGEARNAIIVRTAEAAVAVGGSYGTLSEIALALRLGVPVVGWGTWHPEREGHPPPPIHHAPSPEETARLAVDLARQRRQRAAG
jgi:hypothetical protein